jgi:hypothetical protein
MLLGAWNEISVAYCAGFSFASRRGDGRIAGLCNRCRNTEGGRKDKQDAILIS